MTVIACALGAGCVGERPAAAAIPVEATVLVAITPGKPDAPTETVEVRLREGAATLTARRETPDGALVGQDDAPIDAEEFRALWKMIAREDLLAFEPREAPGQVFDFGERRLLIVYRGAGDASATRHEAVWIRPLRNERRVSGLTEELGRLAAHRASGVELMYFPR